jgi:hypothetical protein
MVVSSTRGSPAPRFLAAALLRMTIAESATAPRNDNAQFLMACLQSLHG